MVQRPRRRKEAEIFPDCEWVEDMLEALPRPPRLPRQPRRTGLRRLLGHGAPRARPSNDALDGVGANPDGPGDGDGDAHDSDGSGSASGPSHASAHSEPTDSDSAPSSSSSAGSGSSSSSTSPPRPAGLGDLAASSAPPSTLVAVVAAEGGHDAWERGSVVSAASARARRRFDRTCFMGRIVWPSLRRAQAVDGR